MVKQHFSHLYATMIEKDLSRVVQPYSVVKLSYVAGKIAMDVLTVKQHLAEMIADGKLRGGRPYCPLLPSITEPITSCSL